ncbi:emp24/gp25L/p24 family/GOLD-domain-containing protein [Dunaliella salina]|uniref:Emp24/gp25L/p24 family/GOLD-domain-containing protein n=1 Tax=Dunaliella salina TaxID=3046 RepID=A0ABQ7GPQ2_DUNSA|nr:emp24/gp25L/p24 family/GOLD-domain-containing protein [Dunaliella salina]KAF5836590.1 emp24/gp25L/p24 family/GOLD-domain-containing protein [Dunaliella salina]|eukprot:KAF5836589.1 emp24/gp25L/p24 family/GOLD-domain-containing protein [Dunaliella salina]
MGLWVLLFLYLQSSFPAFAVKVVIPPGGSECLSEPISDEHFQIIGGARVDGRVMVSSKSQYYTPFLSVRVLSPDGKELWKGNRVHSESHFNAKAAGPGTYKICFTNPKDSRTDASVDLVYFTLAHLRRPAQASLNVPKGNDTARSSELAQKSHADEVSNTVESLSEFMQVISGSQRYLQRRKERHKRTMISNQRRTTWYSLLEVAVLLVVTAVQVITIVSFFKTGRVKISV